MLYGLEVGKDEAYLLQQSRRMRMPVPDRIAEAPELLPGLELFLNAFMELTSCRGLGFGAIGPIPWMTLNTYCSMCDIEGEQREDLIYHVQRMDKAYMDWQQAKARKERESAAQPQGPQTKRGKR